MGLGINLRNLLFALLVACHLFPSPPSSSGTFTILISVFSYIKLYHSLSYGNNYRCDILFFMINNEAILSKFPEGAIKAADHLAQREKFQFIADRVGPSHQETQQGRVDTRTHLARIIEGPRIRQPDGSVIPRYAPTGEIDILIGESGLSTAEIIALEELVANRRRAAAAERLATAQETANKLTKDQQDVSKEQLSLERRGLLKRMTFEEMLIEIEASDLANSEWRTLLFALANKTIVADDASATLERQIIFVNWLSAADLMSLGKPDYVAFLIGSCRFPKNIF